jgi:hypothetical protein
MKTKHLLIGISLIVIAIPILVASYFSMFSWSKSEQKRIEKEAAIEREVGVPYIGDIGQEIVLNLGQVESLEGKWIGTNVLFTPELTSTQLDKGCLWGPVVGKPVGETGIPNQMVVPIRPVSVPVDIKIGFYIPNTDKLRGEIIQGELEANVKYCVGGVIYEVHNTYLKRNVSFYILNKEQSSMMRSLWSLPEPITTVLFILGPIALMATIAGGLFISQYWKAKRRHWLVTKHSNQPFYLGKPPDWLKK